LVTITFLYEEVQIAVSPAFYGTRGIRAFDDLQAT